MSALSEWKKKATLLLQTNTVKEVAEMLFKESGYGDRMNFERKLYGYNRKIKSVGYKSANEAVNAFIALNEYKETRDEDGKVSITETVDRKLTDDELYKRYGRSKEDWRISMVWFKDKQSGFLLSCCFIPLKKTPENTLKLSDVFLKRLNSITPIKKSSILAKKLDKTLPISLMVIPKQDFHANKLDVGGDNNIEERFSKFKFNLTKQLKNASLTNRLDSIVYIVGSDEFNSEWNGTTTKGTPQVNILSHQEGFEKITDFNIDIINTLLEFTNNVEVTLLNGNHDYSIGWHLANLLKRVFRDIKQVKVDDRIDNTKVFGWADNLILINHGDEMKPKDLAIKFPTIAKEMWSKHSNYFVITGDKHHEIAHDFNGIMTYQVPQLSNAKSAWDDKKGYIVGKAEMVNFVFEKDGLSAILRNRM